MKNSVILVYILINLLRKGRKFMEVIIIKTTKRVIILAILLTVGLIGCQSSSKEDVKKNTIVERAIENGKLALADGDFAKSKSNFELALAEDGQYKEVESWLILVDAMEDFSLSLENKEIKKAQKALADIKKNKLHEVFKSQIDYYASTLEALKVSIKKVDDQIVVINELFKEGAFEEVIEEGNDLKKEDNITKRQMARIKRISKEATIEQNKAILAREKAEQEKKVKEEQASTLSLDEMRSIAKEYVDNWNGYDNALRDEWDLDGERVYEFKDGPAERSVGLTVNYKTGEVTPDLGMY